VSKCTHQSRNPGRADWHWQRGRGVGHTETRDGLASHLSGVDGAVNPGTLSLSTCKVHTLWLQPTVEIRVLIAAELPKGCGPTHVCVTPKARAFVCVCMHESWIIPLHFPPPPNPQPSRQTNLYDSATRQHSTTATTGPTCDLCHHRPPAQLFATTSLNPGNWLPSQPASVAWSSEAAPQPWLINQPDPKKTSRRHP
jgi:hypothetical protein